MEHLKLVTELNVTEIKISSEGRGIAKVSFLFQYFTMLVYKIWTSDIQLGHLIGSNYL